jgi:DME family drug/metabolite transporter
LENISHRRARLLLFAAAFLFSTGGAAIKACSMTAWQVAGFRSGIAAVVLLIFMPDARRQWTWRTAAIGCAYAATLIAFVVATKLTTSANAIFLQSTAPLYMLALGPAVLGEKTRRGDLIVLAGIAAGAALLLRGAQFATSSARNPAAGNLVALVSGFTWALTLTGLRWLGKRDADPAAATATVIMGNLIAFAACLPMALPIHEVRVFDAEVLVYLGAFQIALAYVCLTRSVRRVPGFEAATLLLLEPVFNPLWTWMVRGERPGLSAIAGGALILAAALGGTWWKTRGFRRALPRDERDRLSEDSN